MNQVKDESLKHGRVQYHINLLPILYQNTASASEAVIIIMRFVDISMSTQNPVQIQILDSDPNSCDLGSWVTPAPPFPPDI